MDSSLEVIRNEGLDHVSWILRDKDPLSSVKVGGTLDGHAGSLKNLNEGIKA